MSAPHILSDARRAILMKLQREAQDRGLSSLTHAPSFACRYDLGLIDLSPWIRAAVPTLTASQLRRWLQMPDAALNFQRGGGSRKTKKLDTLRGWALVQIAGHPRGDWYPLWQEANRLGLLGSSNYDRSWEAFHARLSIWQEKFPKAIAICAALIQQARA